MRNGRVATSSHSKDVFHVSGLAAAFRPDETVVAWERNFRSDGAVMLVRRERDVDVHEFREALERYRAVRLKSPAP